eukprot:m.6635 g.6635  ORF g.6635 m.6635 type:complete len:386 (+) comp3867_c0_seq1:262-1419(+)
MRAAREAAQPRHSVVWQSLEQVCTFVLLPCSPEAAMGHIHGSCMGSPAGAVLSKSATLVKQDGNPLPRYKEQDVGPLGVGSINSEGLPNPGIDYLLQSTTVGAAGAKPYIVSLSGLSLDDNLEMFGRASAVEGVAAIELNVACPNIPGKPVMAYDFEQLTVALKAVTTHPSFGRKPLGVKLAPYFDMPHFRQAADILNLFPISYVVCINTIGNALIVDTEAEQPLIAPKGGFGGLGGGYVKHTALANVRQMRGLLKDEIDVVGVGGVFTGADAFDHILCGASAVQVATCHAVEGPDCFNRIAKELEELMARKGYNSIDEFRGKLRDFDSKQATKRSSPKKKIALVNQDVDLDAANPMHPDTVPVVLIGIIVLLLGMLVRANHMFD